MHFGETFMRAFVHLVAAALLFTLQVACDGPAASPAILTRPIHHQETGSADITSELSVAAVDYALAIDRAADLEPADSDGYQVLAVDERAPDGLRHVRLRQTHAGLPVVGAEIVVHAGSATFIGLDGFVVTGLDGLDTTSAIAAEQAIAAAEDELTAAASDPLELAP